MALRRMEEISVTKVALVTNQALAKALYHNRSNPMPNWSNTKTLNANGTKAIDTAVGVGSAMGLRILVNELSSQ